jgi:hypothetical protein
MSFLFLAPQPQEIKFEKIIFERPKKFSLQYLTILKETGIALKKDLKEICKINVSTSGFPIILELQKNKIKAEGYQLEISKSKILIKASNQAGLYYGTQTLLQILAMFDKVTLPVCKINDFPTYKTRSYMIDMGRASFPVPLLKRIIRILARLKMNTLHMHLCDDELGGLRFNKLPFGKENPTAISLKELKELIVYARKYHVTIIPEIECWGHAASMIFHDHSLYGAPGMWAGMSFAIGENLFQTLEKVFDELVPVLEKKCQIHIGLDEANWALAKDVAEKDKDKYNPSLLVQRIYDILMKMGKKHQHEIKVHMWADHGGRPLPDKIKDKVVTQPWMYFEDQEENIKSKVAQYSGKNKTPFMMGAGMSSMHPGGHFGATSVWCKAGEKSPNVEGVTICHWENNEVPEQLIGLYGGADYAWTPNTPVVQSKKADLYRERIFGEVTLRMRAWQQVFKDADHEALVNDRGPIVVHGFYMWGDKSGLPVAPTALIKNMRDIVGNDNMDQ